MTCRRLTLLAWLVLGTVSVAMRVAIRADDAAPRTLFDGQSLAGWDVLESDRAWWQAADGVLAGGSLTNTVPHNTFLATRDSFHNFELTLKIRIQGIEGFVNSGIQIRSVRMPGGAEMSGYQVDAGPGWWGKLYDESRRNKVIGEAADLAAVNAAVRPNDWNEYRIRAEGPRIQSWINGVAALDYTETDPRVPQDGQLGIQAHGGGKVLVQVKDVVIRVLPPTPGAMTWDKLRQAPSPDRLSPADELQGFQLPDGFTAELVLAEGDDYGKFVAVAFDGRGRLWTMTAHEYPVDANESPEASQRLFAAGGRDKVLVIDQPFAGTPSPPRVFADGLVIPLGLLPYRDGAFVQYGEQIRFYRDTNGDGRADGHEVVLQGFGVQDSHLFPHQFTRVPGGFILTAQGLFNSSRVRRGGDAAFAGGEEQVRFDHCKLARFGLDGARFEPLTAGPNNIWGLTISREGETWIQEANDIGYPIIPYEPGGLYATGSSDRLRSYQPQLPPPLAPPQMGGTGLSGLALADDADGWPAPYGLGDASPEGERTFYVANPITSRIQMIHAAGDGQRYQYRKGPDFLTSADPRFRPVAIQFGPDGCLYVVDWYNKIISHNEVPRNHPERDKRSGRIWRIRHRSQSRQEPPTVATLPDAEVIELLGAANARVADLAWQELVDRGNRSLTEPLTKIVLDAQAAPSRRAGALWALEGLGQVAPDVLRALTNDARANLRREAVRIAGAQGAEQPFVELVEPLLEDPSPRVRAAIGDALRRIPVTQPRTISLLARFGREPTDGDVWTVYDRNFERYLARWALEQHPDQTAHLLASAAGAALPLENRLLATLALPAPTAAAGLARLLGELKRGPREEEVRVLAAHLNDAQVAEALASSLADPASRPGVLAAILKMRTSVPSAELQQVVSRTIDSWWDAPDSRPHRLLLLEAIGAFRVQAMAPQLESMLLTDGTSREMKLAALRALRELGAASGPTMANVLAASGQDLQLRSETIAAWAESRDAATGDALLATWGELNYQDREVAARRLSAHREGAAALVRAVERGDVEGQEIPVAALENMRALLGEHPGMETLWRQVAPRLSRVLALGGGHEDAAAELSLTGPFTVEAWAQLSGEINNQDSLLSARGVLDLNFHACQLRAWVAGHHDIVIAQTRTAPDTWMHYAVTRDADGVFSIYINGELDARSTAKDQAAYAELRIGASSPPQAGTLGRLAEFRVWNTARSAEEIRDNFDRSFTDQPRPETLVNYFSGDSWGELHGQARVEATLDAPSLVTASQAAERAAKFAHFRALASQAGDPAAGQLLFNNRCLTCHQLAGQGGKIGPALDGAGLTGREALLRNLLTPSAAMEGGYRTFRVLTRDGRVLQGYLVARDEQSIVLRQPNTADLRLASHEATQAEFIPVSVMPEGLLEALQPHEVADLFSYLATLSRKSGEGAVRK